MGSLEKIWLDVPEVDDMEELARAFKNYFGTRWEDAVVGGHRSFVYHKDWEAYFSVTGLRPVSDMTLSDLPAEVKQFNITVGT